MVMRSVLSPVLCLIAAFAPAVRAAGFDQDPPSELASALVKKAKKAQKAGDIGQAYVYYSQASALQPKNRGYRDRAAALQASGATQMRGTGTTSVEQYVGTVSVPMYDSITARELAGERELSSPPMLKADMGRYDLDFTAAPRALFQKVAERYSLQLVFDSDYPEGGTPVHFRLTQVNYREAFDAVQAATKSFIVPVSAHAILVAQDSPAKRNDLEQFVALTLPVPQSISTQELTEIVQVVRQATNVSKVSVDNTNNQIVLRDKISFAAPAQALLAQLFAYHPEVMIDLELLQVSDSDVINYGLSSTNSFPLVSLAKVAIGQLNVVPSSLPAGLANLLSFGGGRTLIGVAAAEVQAMFNETSSSGRSLYSARLRAGSGQASTVHVGEKYPIITGGYIGASSNTTGSTVPNFTSAPAISWENLGLDLKATPRVHGADDVSLIIEASYEVLTGQSASGIPVIGKDKITTNIRLRNDEWAVVAGLMGHQHSKSSTGTWGLNRIPWLGRLFQQTNVDEESGSLLIGIRPHILYQGPEEMVTQGLRVGTDSRPYTPF